MINNKLLKFVIFHFKYDTIFDNCSFSHEGFQNIDSINYFNSEEDVKFLNYFKTKNQYDFGSKKDDKINLSLSKLTKYFS